MIWLLIRDDKHASPEYIAVLDRLVGTCVQVRMKKYVYRYELCSVPLAAAAYSIDFTTTDT